MNEKTDISCNSYARSHVNHELYTNKVAKTSEKCVTKHVKISREIIVISNVSWMVDESLIDVLIKTMSLTLPDHKCALIINTWKLFQQ